ncbi:Putative NtrX-like response regulator [Candidatus Fokinia solitaria]|uniref:Putative response regulator NtrX-like n=1 Tax=Candidatus Fokinia solitaria TaxID=1802984 RepID=A0A2U8BSF0_9RICK|nr:response regulator [Candidatus Fokinia solitaria]AWD33235.1 Putative NtrX-like response regulator [Candidatus Fokinia solitaria]
MNHKHDSILVADDDYDIRELISGILESAGYKVLKCATSVEALEIVESGTVKLALLDIWMESDEEDGIVALKRIKKMVPLVPVIMISGHASPEISALAMKFGAYDFLEKPFRREKLLLTVRRALESSELTKANILLKKREAENSFIGNSKEIVKIKKLINKHANSDGRFMITGAIGTGKTLVSQLIHILSDCELHKLYHLKILKSESNTEKALYETWQKAVGGTLIIEEIDKMPLEYQKKILNIINAQYARDAAIEMQGDIKLIGNSRSTEEECRNNMLPDLYARLATFTIHIPPLSARKGDIPSLIEYFWHYFSDQYNANFDFSQYKGLLLEMQDRNWRCNIRELRHKIEEIIIALSSNSTLKMPEDTFLSVILKQNYKEAKKNFEKLYFQHHLNIHPNSLSKVAECTKVDRVTLYRKLKEFM